MALTNWTLDGNEGLDISTKYAGNSSVRIGNIVPTAATGLYRTGYSKTQVQVIAWIRGSPNDKVYPCITHSSYGSITKGSANIWTKIRVSFWYDAPNNTKFGRLESWDGAAWVQEGSDTNFGLGTPGANSIYLQAARIYGGGSVTEYVWFDEVEVYEASL